MKPLLPVYCRLLGYFVMAVALFLPFIMLLAGRVTDANWVFYKECVKLLMMLGALMVIFAYTKNESAETQAIRNRAVGQAMFITVFVFFGHMVWRVATGDTMVDSSSFLLFLLIDVLCQEFGIKKAAVDRHFRDKQ